MSERVIKTGLSKKYKDMLDAVIGQMSDGYWENTPMMRGYWKFVTTGTAGDEVTLEVDETSGARDGDRRIVNRFYGLSDDAVKKFFADKIKFLIKEEGLGKWDRGNESETDYLSYGEPRYRVKDCYYAYEILKGRNAHKHPEYSDVAESSSAATAKSSIIPKIIMGIKLIKKNNEATNLPTFYISYEYWGRNGVGHGDTATLLQAASIDDVEGVFDAWFNGKYPKGFTYKINEIEKSGSRGGSAKPAEIKNGPRKGDLRYTPAAKRVAQKLGDDLLMAILAAASDEAFIQADESEWKDAVDTDHSLEWNTCQALGWGFADMGANAPFKGDSGKVYSGDEAKNAYNAITALEDDDRYSLFFNNQPRNYSHIRDVVATAMDMAADDEGEDESKRNEGKAYTFTWWDNEPTADRRPTTSADLKNCLHKETFSVADDAEALKLAVEYLCDYIGDDPEDVADTPEEIWNYFDSDWGYGDPIPMVLKQGRRIVKDSGFNPNDEGGDNDDGWYKAVEKELVKKYKFSPGWAETCVDGNWKGLVSQYFDDGKSPEECAKAINDSGANK